MSIQLCLLETGETIIADVKEAIDPNENKSIGYFVSHPFVVDHRFETVVALDNEIVDDTEDKSTIAFKLWAPLAKHFDFKFTYDFVRVIYEPHTSLSETYINLISKWQEDNTEEIVVDKHRTNISVNTDGLEELGTSSSQTIINPTGEAE
jgi:hypothetical protein